MSQEVPFSIHSIRIILQKIINMFPFGNHHHHHNHHSHHHHHQPIVEQDTVTIQRDMYGREIGRTEREVIDLGHGRHEVIVTQESFAQPPVYGAPPAYPYGAPPVVQTQTTFTQVFPNHHHHHNPHHHNHHHHHHHGGW
jgi:hypothetical protein